MRLLLQNAFLYPLSSFLGSPGPSSVSSSGMTSVFTPTNYSVVPGFFIQDEPGFNSTGYDPLLDSFGLLDKSPDRWHNFIRAVNDLNVNSDSLTSYKVLFVARHGQGFHNLAEEKYGTPAWDAYWSRLTTDGEITWGPDPLLTPLGISQAEANNVAWKAEIKAGAPMPQVLYSSPLSRAASTLAITWRDILIEPLGLAPLFKENLRETIGLHTCDQRSPKTEISKRFPDFTFEVPFSEHDQHWSDGFQESNIQQSHRSQQVLNQIFATDPSTFVSITAHGGAIGALFRVIGHQPHSLNPGGMVPIVVKAVGHASVKGPSFAGGSSIVAPPMPTSPPGFIVRSRH